MTGTAVVDPLEVAVRGQDVRSLALAYLGVTLKPKQVPIVRAIVFGRHRQVAIRATTQWGKTKAVGVAIALLLLLKPGQSIAVLSPTNRQSAILRGYLSDCVLACDHLRALLSVGSVGADRLKQEVSKARVTFRDGGLVDFLSLEGKAERLMGLGGYDLVVEDEAALVPDDVHRVRVPRMASKPGSRIVLIGNPWAKAHHFYDACTDEATLQVHVDWRDGLEDGSFTREFLDEQRRKLTPTEWAILYEAEFPDAVDDQLYPWSWVQRAIQPATWTPPPGEEWVRVAGMDCAEGGGDRNVFTPKVVGPLARFALLPQEDWTEADTDVTAERLTHLAGDDVVGVDEGGVGKGIADNARARGCRVHSFKAGREATDKTRFFNLFAEAAWALREALEQERCVLVAPRPELLQDLSRYRWSLQTGRIRVTVAGGKSSGNSPDFGDSAVHAVWTRPVAQAPVPIRRPRTLL